MVYSLPIGVIQIWTLTGTHVPVQLSECAVRDRGPNFVPRVIMALGSEVNDNKPQNGTNEIKSNKSGNKSPESSAGDHLKKGKRFSHLSPRFSFCDLSYIIICYVTFLMEILRMSD